MATEIRGHLRDQRGPASLVTGANARTVITVEVFVEQDQIAPVRVRLKLFRSAIDRPPSILVAKEDAFESLGELSRNLMQRGIVARASWELDLQVVAIIRPDKPPGVKGDCAGTVAPERNRQPATSTAI
jgi:hypothetical protein